MQEVCKPPTPSLVDRVARKYTKGKKRTDQPLLYVLYGGPGSGKTTVIRRIIPEEALKNFVVIDADDFINEFPAWRKKTPVQRLGSSWDDCWQSIDIFYDAVVERVEQKRLNLVVVGGGDLVPKFKTYGYKVVLILIHTPIPIAAKRVTLRTPQTGLFIDNQTVVFKHYNHEKAVLQLAPLADVVHICDNSGKKLFCLPIDVRRQFRTAARLRSYLKRLIYFLHRHNKANTKQFTRLRDAIKLLRTKQDKFSPDKFVAGARIMS